ncbi:MAG: hypothetical protein ACTSU5_11795 [Promethearchaeota archaeon]
MQKIVDIFQEKYPTCPHCGRKLGFYNRLQKCALSGELVCDKCIVSGRFSDSVAASVPAEYREKFRFYNVLPFAVVVALALWLMSSAWYRYIDWTLDDLGNLQSMVLNWVGSVLAAVVLIVLSCRLPHLGTWMFYWWVAKPKNREKLEAAVEANAKGAYRSESRLFAAKTRLFEYLRLTETRAIFLASIVLNAAMVPLFFVVRGVPALAGTGFSAFVGILYVCSLVVNVLVLLAAAGFYCQKTPENRDQKRVVELLSWLYAVLMPVVFLTFILGWISSYEGLLDELSPSLYAPLLATHQVAFAVQSAVAVALAYYLMARAEPNPSYDVNENDSIGERRGLAYTALKYVVTLLFLVLLLLVAALALEISLLDFAIAICVIAPTYLLLGLAFPVTFVVLKLLNRTPKRSTQLFWTATKVGVISACVLSVPLVGTVVWTNPSVESQFSKSFGADWRGKIPPELAAKMRQVPFSAFEAFFGFNTPPVPAKFDITYAYDHPRYVKEKGVVYSNGSERFPNVTHPMKFDCYLPPGQEFGEGAEKFPVIIFFHGIGETKGSRNANLTSVYLANQGYVICDMMYGYNDWTDLKNRTSGKMKGYDFPDTIQHIGNFTHYLAANMDYYHADLSNVYFSGRSYGGWMATVCAYGYNLPFFGSNFSSEVKVRGAIPYYGAHEAGAAGEFLSNGLVTDVPIIRGSPNRNDPDYNAEFEYYYPNNLVTRAYRGDLPIPPTLFLHGTNDYIVPPGWDKRLQRVIQENGGTAIGAYYPLGSHGFDALHWSQYGQSVLYYFERFLALTRADL